MSTDLSILVPVLERPHRVKPLLDAIEATTPGAHVLFLADPGDNDERDAICDEIRAKRDLRIGADLDGGNYAAKINRGSRKWAKGLIFTAADDLEPLPGWLDAAEAKLADGAEVVGVNDLIERNRTHATHFLMTHEYALRGAIDGEPGPFYTGYDHSFCDDELIATAKHRGVYAYAEDAHVRHLHPDAGRAEIDETYRKGRARMRQDRKIFNRRRRLWE